MWLPAPSATSEWDAAVHGAISRLAKRTRTERRETQRAEEKMARQREKLAGLEPGGAPDRPIDVTTASVVEPQARAHACARCGGTMLRVLEHEARELAGRRLRVVRLSCPQCGANRVLYFQIAQVN